MSTEPTPRERFIAALERRPLLGRVPHFELVFFLTMEVFGKVHPQHRQYSQWGQMTRREKSLQIDDNARLYIDIAEHFGHDAIFVQQLPDNAKWPNISEGMVSLLNRIRELSDDKYYLMIHGDPTIGIPGGSQMEELSCRMAEEPEEVEDECARNVENYIKRAEFLKRETSIDGFALCSDYCFNEGAFLPPAWFDRFITPYLKDIVSAYRELGFYSIKHTDGNIMPILDRLLDAKPHALHSLDPQGGVDMAEMVRVAGDKVALCGNVNCGVLQTGTDEECAESARYALQEGMKAPGYIFCTSNCVYTGMRLERYELVRNIWLSEGVREVQHCTA